MSEASIRADNVNNRHESDLEFSSMLPSINDNGQRNSFATKFQQATQKANKTRPNFMLTNEKIIDEDQEAPLLFHDFELLPVSKEEPMRSLPEIKEQFSGSTYHGQIDGN